MTPEICPNCGAQVPRNAQACPECGSDEQTGWSEDAHIGSLDIPDEDFNYEDYVKREFGGESPVPHGIPWGWWLVAIAVLAGMLILWLSH